MSRPVRVLMLVDRIDGSAGGAERFMVGLCTALPRERYEVWVCVTRSADGPLVAELAAAGIRVVVLDRRWTGDIARFGALVALLRAQRFDVLHAHMFGSNVWGTLFGRLLRVPVVIAHEQTWSYRGRPVRRLLDGRFIGRLATRFVAVSNADRERMIALEKVPAHKIVCIPNAYVPRAGRSSTTELREVLELGPDVPVIGTLAMLRPQKALDVLVDAHARVLRSHPQARLVIAGDGSCRAALERQIHRLGLEQRVHLVGVQQDAGRILRALDIAALSSDYEGTPLFMFECMSHGVPLVSTAVGGIPDILRDGHSALLVPRRDASALANALTQLLGDAAQREDIAAAARRELGNHLIETTSRRFSDLYDSLLAARSA